MASWDDTALGLEPVAALRVHVDEPWDLGTVPAGRRRVIPITGGRAEGPAITGEVVDGGADWSTQRADGTVELDARYLVRTDDDVLVQIVNRGVLRPGHRPAALTVARVEAPTDSAHAWVNDTPVVGSVDPLTDGHAGVLVRLHRVVPGDGTPPPAT